MRIGKFAAAALLAVPPPLAAQQPELSVTARVEVAVRTVTVVMTDHTGRALSFPPSIERIEVFEDGRRCEVLAIEPAGERPAERTQAGAPSSSPTAPPAAAPVRAPRRQVLYVDLTFLRTPSARQVADLFAEQADNVLALGTLEVVVADPSPKVVLAATRDAAAVREALARVRKLYGRDRVYEIHRQAREFADLSRKFAFRGRASVPKAGGWSPLTAFPQLSFALEEAHVVAGALARLSRWAASSPAISEGILYLASDGFEPQLAPLETVDEMQRRVRTEVDPGLLQAARDAEHALLTGGWTTVPIAVNPLSSSAFEYAAERGTGRTVADANAPAVTSGFGDHSLVPLRGFADVTGGELVVDPRKLRGEIARLSSAWALTFRMAHPPDGRLHELKIRGVEPGTRVRAVSAIPAGTTSSLSATRVVDALERGVAAGPLPVSVAFTDAAEEKKGRRRAEMHVTVAVGHLAPVLAKAGPGRVRISVAVDIPGSAPFVAHDEKPLPADLPKAWIYDAPVVWPKAARGIAVVAEELATGSLGSATADFSAVR